MSKSSAKYKLVYTKSAFKDVKRLDSVTKKRVKLKIEIFIKSPLEYSKRLTNSIEGDYRWRVGDFRIVFDVDKNNIVILRVAHRREVYRH